MSSVIFYLIPNAHKYTSGDFRELALPNADVIAFVRTVGSGPTTVNCLNIFWAGQDQVRGVK